MRGRSWWPVAASAGAALAAGMVAGCTATTGASPASTGTPHATGTPRGATTAVRRCGRAQTAAGVPIEVEVVRGSVACPTALSVERSYTRKLASGQVSGNGGGAPVSVKGWVCQGFTTPEVLATGKASACHRGTTEILAVLPPPSATPAPES